MAENKLNLDIGSEELSCQICIEEFGEGPKCPRMLLCSHCFCHSCIQTLISESPICPLCKVPLIFKFAEKFPVNSLAIKLLESNKRIRIENENKLVPSKKRKVTTSSKVLSEGFCEEHETTKQFKCMDCSDWVCGTCAQLHHKKCRTLLVKEALKQMQNEEVENIDNILKVKSDEEDGLPKMNEIFKRGIERFKEEINELQLKLKEKKRNFRNLQDKYQEFLLQKDKRQKLWTPVENSEMKKTEFLSNDQFEASKSKLDSDLKAVNAQHQYFMKIPSEISNITDFQTVKYWLECGVEMRAQDGLQFSLLELGNEKLRIHCFQTNQPKLPFITVPFKDLLSFTTGSDQLPTKAFLEIGLQGARNGHDVIVKTDTAVAGSPRVQNFLLLVAGLKGPSYKGIPLVLERDKDENMPQYVSVAAVWKKGNKEVSEAVVNGIEDFGIYGEPVPKRGFVCGDDAESNSSTVYINLEDVKIKGPLFGKFGEVESGLEALDQMKSGKNLYVISCGFIVDS